MRDYKGIQTCQTLEEIAVLKYELGKLPAGDLAEVGVYMGGTVMVMAEECPDRDIYAFDTFEGHPYIDENMGDNPGDNKVGDMKESTFEIVNKNLEKFKTVYLHKGVFPYTAEPIKDKKFALVHLDTDTWRSIKAGLEFFYPRMVDGGVIIVHDYQCYKGVRRATNDFCKDNNLTVEISAQRQGIIRPYPKDKRPVNAQGETPPEVAELVKDIIQGKTVCDVGCGSGEFMVALKKYARKVIGIEEQENLAELARQKGFEVDCINTFFQPLPAADVYYLWSKDQMGVFLKARYERTKGTYILGHSVRPSTVMFLEELGAERRESKNFRVYITKI